MKYEIDVIAALVGASVDDGPSKASTTRSAAASDRSNIAPSRSLQVAAPTISVLIKPQITTRRRGYMTAIIFILVTGTVIAVTGTAALVLIVIINIQTVDRSKRLMQEPRNVLDAATRRILGTCTHSSGLRQMKQS
jgi:hypothetical protein